MKRAELTLFLLRMVIFFAMGATAVQADTVSSQNRQGVTFNNGPATISYDRSSDQLSIVADSASLRLVLGRVAQLSGIEVLFDDLAEQPVSIDIQSETLKSGLNRLLKGRNFMMRYDRDEQQKLLLIGVVVLPVGEQDSGRTRPLVAMNKEAYSRAKSQLTIEQTQQIDLAQERWQARLSELPAETRNKLENHVNERLLKQAQREQQRAEKNKKRELRHQERQKQRQQAQEKSLEHLSPEERTVYEQRRKESREQVKAALFGGQK